MEAKKSLLTYAGLKKLEDELHDLKVNRRKEVACKIKGARRQATFPRTQSTMQRRMSSATSRPVSRRLKILKNVEVVVEDEVDVDKINVGCTVKVYDVEYDEEMEFKIVGSSEANSLQGKISNESPVGKALIGRSVGDTVQVETQAGEIAYKVLGIERSI